MPCYSPLKGYKSKTLNPSGKRSIVFTPRDAFVDLPLDIPCGQCIGCRLERSRQWAIRCAHEASLHEHNCFITLTYNNENLPKDGSLHVDHFQLFMKRLRKKYGKGVRYFHCGEYGEKFGRPHYHACIFNLDFHDKIHWKTHNGQKYYTSKTLDALWEHKGYCVIGDVTFQSAAYVARYITKKITGKYAEAHYQGRKPEYTTMSRRPGIAKHWLAKYASDVYPGDFVVMNDQKMKPPKYYDTQYELDHRDEFLQIKHKRLALGFKNKHNSTHDRLSVRETIQKEKFKRLKRSFENAND